MVTLGAQHNTYQLEILIQMLRKSIAQRQDWDEWLP